MLTQKEFNTLSSMSKYWKEVRRRDDQTPLYHEMKQACDILGPSRILQLIEKYLELNKDSYQLFYGKITDGMAREWTLDRFAYCSDKEKEFIRNQLKRDNADKETENNQKLLFLHYFTVANGSSPGIESTEKISWKTAEKTENDELITTRFIEEYYQGK